MDNSFLGHVAFAWLALFPILNPPAMAPVFLALTSPVDEVQRNHLAFKIGLYTAIFLSILLLLGGWMLKILGLSIPVIAIAGGVLLFHSAWRMLNRESPRPTPDADDEGVTEGICMRNQAFFPLTLPVTAGPGAMAVTLAMTPRGTLLESSTLLEFLAKTLGIVLAGTTVFVFYRFSGPLIRRIGKTGATTISQISAFVLLAIGVQIIWGGVKELLLTLQPRPGIVAPAQTPHP